VQHPGERGRGERRELEGRLPGGKAMLAVAVRGDVEHQHVLVGIHGVPDPLERAREVGDARDRQLLQRVVVVAG
jgi:hypothetical protein